MSYLVPTMRLLDEQQKKAPSSKLRKYVMLGVRGAKGLGKRHVHHVTYDSSLQPDRKSSITAPMPSSMRSPTVHVLMCTVAASRNHQYGTAGRGKR